MRKVVHAAILSTFLSVTGCVSTTNTNKSVIEIVEKSKHAVLYDHIIIEIQAVTGMSPTKDTLAIFSKLLEQYKICNKENIIIIYKQPVDYPGEEWSNALVRKYEYLYRAIRDVNPLDRDFSVFVSYLPGKYGEPNMRTVAGLQYNRSAFAVFGNYNGMPGATLLLHEFGHLIGMVNRKCRKHPPINPDRPNHCNNRGCVMFWQWNKERAFCNTCESDINEIIRLKNKIEGPI